MDSYNERLLSCAPEGDVGSETATATCSNHGLVDKVRFEQLRDIAMELLQEEDEEDRPSDYSIRTFEQLISETCERLGGAIPRPAVIPDSEHGIRIAWKNAEQELRVVVPESQDRRAYIYFRRGSHSELDETLSADLLVGRLEAMN